MSWFGENTNVPVARKAQAGLAMRDNLLGLMDDFFRGWDLTPLPAWSEKLGLALDVSERDDAYVVEAELPGVKKADVSVELNDNVLTIKGEKRVFNEENKDQYYRMERSYGNFTRSVRLPADADEEKVSAKMEEGVLHVEISKSTEATKKRKTVSIS